jgi:hypothetical protein
MRDTIEMAREAGFETKREMVFVDATEITPTLQRIVILARADEREASIDAVLQIIKELRPALVLVAFADRDKAWAIDKIKENIEKLKEKQ